MTERTKPSQLFFLLQCILLFISIEVHAFCPVTQTQTRQRPVSFAGFDKDTSNASTTSRNEENTKKKGDSVRSTTGIRPSLHPVTINCVAEALLLRSKHRLIAGTLISFLENTLYSRASHFLSIHRTKRRNCHRHRQRTMRTPSNSHHRGRHRIQCH